MTPTFPCRTRVDVQWGDADMLGHVNNVVYFRWFETARIHYFEAIEIERNAPKGVYPILASVRCDYRAQLRYPETVSVEISCDKLGRSSVHHVYRVIATSTGAVVAEGEGTWVCFDYGAQKTVPLPETLRAAIEAYEGTQGA